MPEKKPDVIVAGVNLSRPHPAEDILDMWEKGILKSITMQGYCARANGDGTCSFVPWYESRLAEDENPRDKAIGDNVWTPKYQGGRMAYRIRPEAVAEMKQDIEREHPIVRRTPQQRVAAMVLRLMGEAKRHGRIPGMSDEQLKTIMGEYWKVGDPVTEDMVRRVTAHFLNVAQTDNRRENDRHVTRIYPTA